MSRTPVDPETYAVTGKQYTAPDSEGHLHVVVKSLESPSAPWTTYTGSAAGVWVITSRQHRTLADAKSHLLTVGGWAAR
jgi:hypothetical protein